MHRKKKNAVGHHVVQADGKLSKGGVCWYFNVTVGTSSLKHHLQNGALDDLDKIKDVFRLGYVKTERSV